MKNQRMPTGRIGRALTGGCTVAKVGGKVLGYYAKRPFLSEQDDCIARENAFRESARTLFQGLSLLKGTALKMAQMLSLELDILPEAVCRELARSYHQVPPINRALARKVVQDGLGRPPEVVFRQFDPRAFAAASLGQVHRAVSVEGQELAVKIQYPGIADTIQSDVSLLRRLLGPVVENDHLQPALREIAARLHEEVNYLQEADNLMFFAHNLVMDGVRTPRVLPDLTARTVMTTTMMPGKPLDLWLKENPDQESKDHIAQKLSDLVLKGLYELHVIHADPNPGNFIVNDDLTIGLVDFGCVKRLRSGFVDLYRQLAMAASHQDKSAHFELILRLGLISPDLDATTRNKIREISDTAMAWFSRLFSEETFDFRANSGYMGQGQAVMRQYQRLHRHLRMNPEFIFLDRTRYGLLRIFEMLGARVRFRNLYEY